VAGWEAFIRRPWYLFGLSLAFFGLFAVSIGDAAVTAFSAVLYGGYIAMLIKHFHGAKIEFDDIFVIQDRWVYYAGLTLIKAFFIILGFLCFIIPGIYLSIRWMFAEILVIDQNMKPLEALKASSKLTEGVRWKLFWMSIVMMLLVFLGLAFFIVGAIMMSVVVMFAYIKVYDDLKSKLHNESEVSESNTIEETTAESVA
jgi:hypothetical protein